jgi:hypothetical protein
MRMKISGSLKKIFTTILAVQVLTTSIQLQAFARNHDLNSSQKTEFTISGIKGLDDLFAADAFVIYTEIQWDKAASQADSYAKMFGPFTSLLKKEEDAEMPKPIASFLEKYSSEFKRGRAIVAALTTKNNLPNLIAALELSSVEVAQECEKDLKILVKSLADKHVASKATKKTKKSSDEIFDDFFNPAFITIKRLNNLVLISEKDFNLADLRPNNATRLIDEPRMKSIRERFSNEAMFYFLDVTRLIETIPVWVEKFKKLSPPKSKHEQSRNSAEQDGIAIGRPGQPDLMNSILDILKNNLAAAFGASVGIKDDTYVAKTLVITKDNESASLSPLFPVPILGSPLVSDAVKGLPSDVTVAGIVSIDFSKSYDKVIDLLQSISKLMGGQPIAEPYIAKFEEENNLKIKDDLLSSLGNEVAFAMTIHDYSSLFDNLKDKNKKPDDLKDSLSLVLLLPVMNKIKIQELLTKYMSAKPAGSTQVVSEEKFGDTVITSSPDLSYGFVDNFLVIADKANLIRSIIEARSRGTGLSSNVDYQVALGAQASQPMLGHFYVSKDLVSNLAKRVSTSSGLKNKPEIKEALANASLEAKPMIYTISSDQLGAYHEVRLPKELFTLYFAYMVSIVERTKSEKAQTTPKTRNKQVRKRPSRRRVR